MQNTIRHWATVIDIVQYGLEGNPQKVRDYAEVLLQLLEKDGQDIIVKSLRRELSGSSIGEMVYTAEQQ